MRTKYVEREDGEKIEEKEARKKRGECRGCLSTIDVNYDYKSASVKARGREENAFQRCVMICGLNGCCV